MSYEVTIKYTCDNCGSVETLYELARPEGWEGPMPSHDSVMYLFEPSAGEHRCLACIQAVKEATEAALAARRGVPA